MAVAVLAVLVAAEVVLFLRPARAEQGNTIDYTVGQHLSVDEPSALVPDPVSHEGLRTTPATCSLLPQCQFFLLDLHYPASAGATTNYFTEIKATLHGAANYQLGLFADPQGNANEVANSTSTARVLTVHLVTAPIDPVQEFGISLWMVAGAVTPVTLSITSSTQAFPNPFESLNPVIVPPTIPPPTPTTVPPPLPTIPPAPPPTVATPPPTAAPDQGLATTLTDNSAFNAGLAAPNVQIFKKAAAVRPPGKPSALQLWLALLALPVAIICVFPVLVRRRRDRGLL
ncbi:MAG: hypothetical protein ACYDH6_15255 [Acidimicrobiales bacterium]